MKNSVFISWKRYLERWILICGLLSGDGKGIRKCLETKVNCLLLLSLSIVSYCSLTRSLKTVGSCGVFEAVGRLVSPRTQLGLN